MQKTNYSSELGSVIPLFAIFTVSFISLLVYSIDGYFLHQSRLDLQNTGEYLSLAALSAYYDPSMSSSDLHLERRSNAVSAIQDIIGSNDILGFESNRSFLFEGGLACNSGSCSCENNGTFMLEFGQWDGINFNPIEPMVVNDPSSCDISMVNSVKLTLVEVRDNSFMRFFHNYVTQSSNYFSTDSVASIHQVGPYQAYRLIKNSANGTAITSHGTTANS